MLFLVTYCLTLQVRKLRQSAGDREINTVGKAFAMKV